MKRAMSFLVLMLLLATVLGSTSYATTNYALGKTVTATVDPPASYWVNDPTASVTLARLTDGATDTAGDIWGKMAAYDESLAGPTAFVVDLGSVKNDIVSVQVDNAVNPWGSKLASAIVVSGSLDGTTYKTWGNLYDTGTGQQTHLWGWAGFERSARYVKFEITWPLAAGQSYALYELSVFNSILPYAMVENYAMGKTMTVTPEVTSTYWVNPAPDAAHARWVDGVADTAGDTWGLLAGWDDTLAAQPVIVIDLGSVKNDIGLVSVNNAVNAWGSTACSSIAVSGSTDGTTFSPWGALTDTGSGQTPHEWKWTGEEQSARYVKLELTWSLVAYQSYLLSEISILSANRNVPVELSTFAAE